MPPEPITEYQLGKWLLTPGSRFTYNNGKEYEWSHAEPAGAAPIQMARPIRPDGTPGELVTIHAGFIQSVAVPIGDHRGHSMTDHPTPEQINLANDTLKTVSTLLDLHDWAGLAAEANHIETTAPFMDPTWFMHHSDAVANNQRLYRATANYLAELHKIVDEAKARASR